MVRDMPHTKWKQDFFSEVEPIALADPLASILGATENGEPIYYSYADCVKLAGHACASVTSAFQMTRLGLKALYKDELPVRGEIEVRFAGSRTDGANGPIGQVIGYITGAAVETGFHGLGGRYARDNLFIYDENMDKKDSAIAVSFKRLDKGDTVAVYANPGLVPMTDEEREYSSLMPQVIGGSASEEEREKFYKYWQGKNRKIALDDNPGVFKVERIS